MKRIVQICFLFGLLSFATKAKAQSSMTVDFSPLYTSFKYADSQGVTLNSEYNGIYTGSYGLGYQLVTEKGLMLRTGIGMRKAGATMVYDNMNYTWDLQYADIKLGGGYMLKLGRLSPYLMVSGYYAFMLSGFQTINNENFDIKNSKSLSETDYGIVVSPGVKFTFSSIFSSYVEFNYLMGLQNLESDDAQKSSNLAYGLTLGVAISFGK